MSLNWDLSEIQDYERVCFITATYDDRFHGITKGDRILNPVTNVLIWATIAVDLPGITRENAPEFFARLRFTELLDGPMLIRAEVDGVRPEGSAAFVTEAEVHAHVGLKANVSPKSRREWLKRFDNELSQLVARFEEKRTRAAAAVEAIRFE